MGINKKKIVIAILKWLNQNWFKILIIISLIYLIAWLRNPFSQINVDITIRNDSGIPPIGGVSPSFRVKIEP